MLHQQTTLNCNGKILSLQDPIVMGILNVTPDSFFDGGRYKTTDTILVQVEKMLQEGARIIDVGGMSSRPGAATVEEGEELERVLPVVELILQNFPETIISVDTVRSSVARQSIEAGVGIINDISFGQFDDQLLHTVAEYSVPYVLMHMKGEPKSMQKDPTYDDVVIEVLDFFIEKVGQLRALGMKDIILDVGFGFGKTIEHNYDLLKNLNAFRILGLPLLVGLSRKSMIYKFLKTSTKEALNGTTALHMESLNNGAKILRAHDVKEAVETIQLWKMLAKQNLR